MKKMSFAALMTCVLLTLTVAAAVNAVSSDGGSNNIILSAIDNAVTRLQNSITNSQNDINAHTDALAPKSLVININTTVPSAERVSFDLLPITEGTTYGGHITLTIAHSASLQVRLSAYVSPGPHAISSELGNLMPGDGFYLNVDFSGFGLKLEAINWNAVEPAPVIIYGVVQYTVSTNVETFTVP